MKPSGAPLQRLHLAQKSASSRSRGGPQGVRSVLVERWRAARQWTVANGKARRNGTRPAPRAHMSAGRRQVAHSVLYSAIRSSPRQKDGRPHRV